MPLRTLSGYTPIGAMSRQITLFLPGQRNSVDGTTDPPAPFGTSWATKRPLQGQEIDKAQQIAQKVSALWVLPYQLGIVESMTFTWENRTLQIAAIDDPDEMHFELHLYAFEIGQNAGQQS
jgi:SPP1 family predicted phage head-tail adaptor